MAAAPKLDPFFETLLSRGETLYSVKLSEKTEMPLVENVIRDIQDAFGQMQIYRENMIEMNENWRGMTTPKDFPFEDCANVRVPFTSVIVQQMIARFMKAIFGGEYIAEFSSLDKVYTKDETDDFNRWFDYELREIVKLKPTTRDILGEILKYGNAFPMPYWDKRTQELRSYKRFTIPEEGSVSDFVDQQAVMLASSYPGVTVSESPDYGVYKLVDIQNKPAGQLLFSIVIMDGVPELKCEIRRRETVFDGVEVYVPNIEDYVLVPSAGTIEEIPFWALRRWVAPEDFRQGIIDGEYIDLGKEENDRIAQSADVRIADFVAQEETELQDSERGTDQKDSSGYTPHRKYIEVYKWEGWWRLTDKDAGDMERYLEPKVQYCVQVAVRTKRIIAIHRLEDLNKDGKRSPVHFGFIHELNRLLDIGLAEWVRHVQATLDAIDNQRLDAGLITNIPWGFYKPSAGFNREVLRVKIGEFLPVSDPQAVNMPQSNYQPMWSFEEERMVWQYGMQQGGMNEASIGQSISKRQSASEFVGTASAADLRTGDAVDYILESFRELVYRILGLYQQFAPRKRVFQVAGENGLMINKEFDIDKLQGRIVLRLTANLQQTNQELQQKIALDMLQILMNGLFIQTGVVQADTIFAAAKKLTRAMGYEGVPLHKPDMPPMSDSPQEEHRQIAFGKEPIGPTPNENFEEHLHAHAKLASDPRLEKLLSSEAQQMLADHIAKTTQMQQVVKIMRTVQQAQALQLQKSLVAKGINPGQAGGGQPGDNAEAGTQAEGVSQSGGAPGGQAGI
jgi:hypothetical protein